MKIVEVFWLDATYEAGECTEDELGELAPVPRSHVGYLLHEADDLIRLSPGANYWSKIRRTQDTFDNSLAISRGMIQKIVILRDDD